MSRLPATVYSPAVPYSSVGFGPSTLVTPRSLAVQIDGTVSLPAVVVGGSFYTISSRDTTRDLWFDVGSVDNRRFYVTTTLSGSWANKAIASSPLLLTCSIAGTMNLGIVASGLMELTLSLLPSATFVSFSSATKRNWVKWSNIGNLSFTVGKDNIAGERPLDWKGWIYDIKKLGSKVVAYGQNGVSYLIPASNTYGLQTISRVGLKGKGAVCGTDFEHFYIDQEGKLWKLTETLELLDYSEYLGDMLSSVVMSLDQERSLIYICDGVSGYMYSIKDKSLSAGPVNVTAIGRQSGTLYVGAPTTITTPAVELCTDIYDMGNRKRKTIYSLEIGTETTAGLYATIDFRKYKEDSFRTLEWHSVNPDGFVVTPCYGVEFRFRLKQLTYSYIEIDYIKINGILHGYSYLDTYSRVRGTIA